MRAAEKVVLSIFLQWDKEPSDVGQDRIDAWYLAPATSYLIVFALGLAPGALPSSGTECAHRRNAMKAKYGETVTF